MAKVNIDENQQIAEQLKIQSIPAVFAFKDKQFVNAFQGVIPEKEIINFLEKCLGEKLENNFDEFYEEIQSLLSDEDFNQAKTMLENFISKNTKEVKGICFYADCLISLNEVEAANELLKSLDDELLKNDSIQKILKRLELVNQKYSGPSLDELKDELSKSPQNVEIVLKISENYFANNKFDEAFEMPGGGLVNLDVFRKLFLHESTTPVLLTGEATFHQFHGGVATNVPATEKMWDKFDDEYERLRGRRFDLIGYPRKPRVLGELNTESRRFFLNDELQSGGH